MAGEQEQYGCMAFFETPEALVEAVRALRKAGYMRIEAYTPFPLEALDEALDIHSNAVPLATFVGGAVGAIGMLAMQYIAAVIHYDTRGRATVCKLAGIYSAGIGNHVPACCAWRCVGDADRQPSADVLSPGVSRRAVRARKPGCVCAGGAVGTDRGAIAGLVARLGCGAGG